MGYSMGKGTIRQLVTNHSWGFIETEQGENLFFHSNQLQGVSYHSLREGQEVEFEVRRAFNGRAQALKVKLAEH